MTTNPDLRAEEDRLLEAMMPLLDSKSSLLRNGLLKDAMLFWYSCHYAITNKNGLPRFQRGPNKKTSLPDVAYIRATHFISNAVAEMIRLERPPEPIRLEHCLPHKVIDDRLSEQKPRTTDALRNFLKKHIVVGFITKAEDDALNKAYRSSMPENWDGLDPFARYSAAEIEGIQLRDATGQPLEANRAKITRGLATELNS